MSRSRYNFIPEYKPVDIGCLVDIVQHSFIVQNSLTSLDLELSQSYRCFRAKNAYTSYDNMLNTEEKCHKFHSKITSLLYKLHLDLPTQRVISLKQTPPLNPKALVFPPCIAQIQVIPGVYNRLMVDLAYHACINANDSLRAMKWLIKCDSKLKYNNEDSMPLDILKSFIDCLLVEKTDLDFVKTCIRRLPFKKILGNDGNPRRVRDVLYLVHRKGGRSEHEFFANTFTPECFLFPTFVFVEEALKFLDAPRFNNQFIGIFRIRESLNTSALRWWHWNLVRNKGQRGKNVKRCALLQHLHWTYRNRSKNPSLASESLRMVWDSINDPFLTLHEIIVPYARYGPGIIASVKDFYFKAVGGLYEEVEPRMLKHYCRSAIRNRLWECMQWLPEGIEKLSLPMKLQSYLKLEKQLPKIVDDETKKDA